ncbi:MAG TPA: hypothetical protein VMW48_12780 [Vicinamibacterales bacterium]|nr:hypothetical protein [Vicinamibacterales bacterium]
MTSKTRYFVIVAFGILALGLTTGLVASLAGGLPVALTKAAGPDDLGYVPPQAVAVAYANVREVMVSELRQRLKKLEPDSAERDDFEAKTGVNIERDIDAVVAAMMPAAEGASSHDSRPLVVVRGRFDQVRIEGLARDRGAAIDDYQGVRIVEHTGDKQTLALGFVEPGAVVVGSVEAVRAAIDAKRSGRNVLDNADLMRLVGDLDASNAWVVGRFDQMLAGKAGLPGDLQAKMPALSWFSAAGHLNGGITGTFKAEAKDDEAAANLRDMLRGVVAMAKLQTSDNPGLKAMVDSLQLGGEGKTVAVAFSVPAEMFDALEAMRLRQRRPADAR